VYCGCLILGGWLQARGPCIALNVELFREGRFLMSLKNSSAGVILKKLGRFMLQLDTDSLHAFDYINAHCPKYSVLEYVSNCGDILGLLLKNGLPDWCSFDDKRVV